jgi:hypothetical protein
VLETETAGADGPADRRLRDLIASSFPGARVLRVQLLGTDQAPDGTTTKGAGYGAPIRIDIDVAGKARSLVLHTATANRFGHDRRADRAAEVLLAFDTFGSIPAHVAALDVGAFREDGGFVSLKDSGEFYLLTDWAEGGPYAEHLRRIQKAGRLETRDIERVDRLADYLVELHQERIDEPVARDRAIRDLLGSGEGIFGIVDGYPEDSAGIAKARLQRIESLCLDWRWKLKALHRPLVRTHGDFHPFNLLFDDQGVLSVLDTSRGSCGDAADDVSCLAINFPFFALENKGAWKGGLGELWERFWRRYLDLSGDAEVLDVVAPYLAWRGLVLANPVWYPKLDAQARSSLLDFVEAVLAAPTFSPQMAEGMFR